MAMLPLLLAGIGVAMLQASPAATPTPRKERGPNDMVCKREEMLGSRLQSRKVCRTRAQWEELRLLDRANVERSQLNACQRQGGC